MRHRLLLLAFCALWFVPLLVSVIHASLPWAVLAVTVTGVCLLLAVVFFFPYETLGPIVDWRARRRAFRAGRLPRQYAIWLLARHRDHAAWAPYSDGPGAALIVEMVHCAGLDPDYGRAIVAWCRHNADLTLLHNALLARITPRELTAHLHRTPALDPDAVATLAALRVGPDGGAARARDHLRSTLRSGRQSTSQP